MVSTPESFAELGLSAPILTALAEVGYETPSPIQAACIPHLLEGQDLLGEAQTGTGKTAAFALPLLDRLQPDSRRPQILVLTPTRELAIQVAEAFQRYAKHIPGFHVLPIYGGQSMVVQLRALSRGAQVIVGTPGRVMDHLERKSLVLDELRALVLDEADEMLRMGFIDDVEWILQHTPSERQTALFSATMPDPIRRVARQYLREPREVKIKAATATVSTIRQRYWPVRGVHKLDALTRILEVEDDFDAAIIFVRTKNATVELADKLGARGYDVAALNGDMTQALRERVIEQLKSGSLDLVVATDVAARGIDVPRISHVINYDIPYDTEAYVHRIGRTGRAGRQGTAILFVAPRETGMLRAIERATRQPIEQIALPTKEAVADRRVAQFKQQIAETLAELKDEDLDFFGEVVEQLATEHSLDTVEIAAALAFMAQKERPLQLEESGRGWDVATAPVGQQPVQERKPRRENRDEILSKRREFSDGKLQRYRIAVGRRHNVTPKEIVGAIANEGGIDGKHIGQINLFDDYSTVELPQLPDDLLNFLKATRVRNQPIDIRPAAPGEGEQRERPRPQARGEWEDRPRPQQRGEWQDRPRRDEGHDRPRPQARGEWQDRPQQRGEGHDRPQGRSEWHDRNESRDAPRRPAGPPAKPGAKPAPSRFDPRDDRRPPAPARGKPSAAAPKAKPRAEAGREPSWKSGPGAQPAGEARPRKKRY